MKKILIIGSGFIGMHLAKKLVEVGGEVTLLSRDKGKISSWDLKDQVTFVEGSILDQDVLDKNIVKKDVIINLTGLVDRRKVEGIAIESLKINCLGELNVLESIRKFNPSAIHIFLGSRAQFGKSNKNGKFLGENEPQNPISLYGIHKKTCEEYIKYYQKLYGLQICSLRISAVYGPSLVMGQNENILVKFIKKSLKGEDLVIFGDGKQINDFIYIEDLVNLMLIIIEKRIQGIYNVGYGKGFPIIEIAKKIVEMVGKNNKIIKKELSEEEDMFELGGSIMNISEIKEVSGWEPQISFEEGLEKIKKFYIENK